MKQVSVKVAAGIGVLGLLVGFGLGLYIGRVNADHELLSLSLGHTLDTAGICANALKLQSRPDPERLVMLLERRMDSEVDRATQLVDEGAKLYLSSPSLRDCARRAAEHYGAVGNEGKKKEAEALFARLGP